MTDNLRSMDRGWKAIFDKYDIHQHDFNKSCAEITAAQIKSACQHFKKTAEKEVRILCTQTTREMRPQVFKEMNLFILPIRNGNYVVVRGEGYVDIPLIESKVINYSSKLEFDLDTSVIGDSEMQHLDFAYAVSMVREFMQDDSLVLTIRGRKYTPEFSFTIGDFNVTAKSVQTEVDSGYEGRDKVVLIEAKNSSTINTIIRQLYYPFRQWSEHTDKKVSSLFFEKKKSGEYHFWEFGFADKNDYNSIELLKSARYKIASKE